MLAHLRTADMPPFDAFARSVLPPTPLRAAITAATRRPEPECLPPLIEQASLPAAETVRARVLAKRLAEALREKTPSGGVEGLIHEYALSSQEGVALMCLAEALLRIPDDETRDALIRDKIGGGDWRAHLGHSPSLFVNAATWGLLLTGRLTATNSERNLSAALTRLIARGGVSQRVGFGLPQGRLVRPRVDAEQHFAFLHGIAFAEIHRYDLAIDARLERDRLIGLDVADSLQPDRNRLLQHRGDADRHRGQSLRRLAALLRPAVGDEIDTEPDRDQRDQDGSGGE